MKPLLLAVVVVGGSLTTTAFAAPTLEGNWTGNLVSAGKARIPANAAFNWTTGKWAFTMPVGSTASYATTLKIEGPYDNLTGVYAATDKANTKNSNEYAFDGNFNFNKKLMVWTPGKLLSGKTPLANTVIRSLTYSQDGDYEYLKGRWAAQDGTNGVMEFRRDYDGVPLEDKAAQVLETSDFILPDTDGNYFLKKDDWFLCLNDGKDGILSKKDADGDVRLWKFEAAPEAFAKSFRIVPVGKDDSCLEMTDPDSAVVSVGSKEDKPEGAQYWRLEKNGPGVILVNVKFGGRGLYIEDEGSGETILRSRNEAHENVWTTEKQ
ncbi:hypothetical protein IAD21_00634 [Abditibacteriota bacterium]|nr:hypothetical protein IAD21_00634 [Abditibacteriota bacterium]